MTDTVIPVQGCFDEPDSRDYKFLEVFGEDVVMPNKVDLTNQILEVQNQGIPRNPSTTYACTCFGIAHAVNSNNIQEGVYPIDINVLGEDLRSRQIKPPYRGQVTVGAYLQDALKQAKNEGLIAGYTLISGLYQMKQALAKKQPVYTCTTKANWLLTKQTGIFHKAESSYGHAFTIVGYDDETQQFKVVNSYGPQAYKLGYFYLGYDDIDALGSCYAVADMSNIDQIRAKEDKIAEQKSVELGLRSGTNPEAPATRKQVAIMIFRALKMVSKIIAGTLKI